MLGFKKSAGDDKPPNHTVLSRLRTDSLKGRQRTDMARGVTSMG